MAAQAGTAGAGERLPFLDTIQPLFGRHDLMDIRAHTGAAAGQASRALGAEAFATGDAVAFGGTPTLHSTAHEAAHVVQQRGGVQLKGRMGEVGDRYEQHADAVADRVVRGESAEALLDQMAGGGGSASASTPAVQRRVNPENVSTELVGQTFTLTDAFTSGSTTVNAGDSVIVIAWDNAKSTATVQFMTPLAVPVMLDCPKKLLRPSHTKVAGMHEYSAGVDGQAKAVEKAEKKLADWNANGGSGTQWTAEKTRLEDVVKKKTAVLNKKLIQEHMFNRFDDVIKREVDAANTAAGFSGKAALDPNLLKSMLFQESQLGTSGEHLEDPPSHPVKSRFNLGQVIDSSALALLTMLENEQPTIITTFKLGTIRTDLATAQKRREELKKKSSRTSAEDTELADLDAKSQQSWEAFIWGYKATGSAVGFGDAVTHFFQDHAAGEPDKNLDYEFWIHMAVLWLFEKHKKGQAWEETIRKYNGGGTRAKHYKEAVSKRAKAAAKADKAGKDYVPDNI
jgi:hypothetical protein